MKRLNHSLKINILFALIVILLFTATFLINGIALELSNRYPLSVDLTANAAYKIGEDTKTMLSALDVPVEIYVLSSEGGFSGSAYLDQAKRIISQYPRYSGNILLRYIDYAADPSFAVNYPDLSLSHGDLIISGGGRTKHVLAANLFNYTYTQDGNLAITSSRAEEALTSAIVSVTSGRTVRIAVLTGNGVAESSLFTALLSDNNYELASVNLTTSPLDGYDVALLFAPESELSEDVIRKLEAFLYNDGKYGKTLFYTASAAQGTLPNLEAFLSEWGVSFLNGAVFETKAERTYQYQPYYPTAVYEQNKYADMLRDKSTPFLMPLSRPMRTLFTAKDKYYVETLLSFSDTSGVRPADAGEDFTAADATVLGPMPALVLSSFNVSSPDGEPLGSNIVISSSTGIFDTIALQNTSLTNSEYLLNLIGDLTNRTDTVKIQSKTLAGRTLGVTSSQASTLGVVLVGVLPLAILAAGVAVWLFRRYK